MAQKKRRDAADAGVGCEVSAGQGADEMRCRRWKMVSRRLRRRGDRRRERKRQGARERERERVRGEQLHEEFHMHTQHDCERARTWSLESRVSPGIEASRYPLSK